MNRRKFGEILVEAGVLTPLNLEKALELQAKQGGRLGKILEALEFISEKDITLVLAHQYGLQAVSKIAERVIPEAVLELIDSQVALEKMVFPLRRTEKALFLAVVNPLDRETLDDFSRRLGLRIIPFLTTPSEIHSAVRRHYLGEATSDNQRWRILVVGPGNEVGADILQALSSEGFQVFTAANLPEGLKAVLRHSPHLVFVDTSIARMDGFEMLQILQSNDLTKDIPAIAVTAEPSLEEEVRLLNHGYFDYLGVPLPHERLIIRAKRSLRITYGKVENLPDREGP